MVLETHKGRSRSWNRPSCVIGGSDGLLGCWVGGLVDRLFHVGCAAAQEVDMASLGVCWVEVLVGKSA